MKILLVGGSGQLGTEIRRWNDHEIVAPGHAELDLEDAQSVDDAFAREKPDAFVNAAAFHNVDRCEEQPDRAMIVNAWAVERAARICRDREILFVTVSTDYVFDGTAARPYVEEDVPNPISAYGRSKRAGELRVTALRSEALVVRTCGVYGVRPSASKGYTFIDRIIAQARAGEPVRVVSDVVASPTFAGHLADGLRGLLERRVVGTYHLANEGPVSWYDFACEALVQAGIDHAIEPISASEWKAGARRPAFSALASDKARRLGVGMPSWREGIGAYLSAREAAGTAS
jgi:dTDP-4-dehydrorhamnose reductase